MYIYIYTSQTTPSSRPRNLQHCFSSRPLHHPPCRHHHLKIMMLLWLLLGGLTRHLLPSRRRMHGCHNLEHLQLRRIQRSKLPHKTHGGMRLQGNGLIRIWPLPPPGPIPLLGLRHSSPRASSRRDWTNLVTKSKPPCREQWPRSVVTYPPTSRNRSLTLRQRLKPELRRSRPSKNGMRQGSLKKMSFWRVSKSRLPIWSHRSRQQSSIFANCRLLRLLLPHPLPRQRNESACSCCRSPHSRRD